MGWFIDGIAKGTIGASKIGYKTVGNSPLAASMTGLTVAGYAGMAVTTAEQSDNQAIHYSKYAAATGIDIASDAFFNWATKPLEMMGPYGKAAAIGIQVATNFLGPGFIGAFDHMDEQYNRLRKQGMNYEMTQSSAQAMQRQLMNLQGAGSNLAEMMHN